MNFCRASRSSSVSLAISSSEALFSSASRSASCAARSCCGGERQVAVLDAKGDRPQIVDHGAEIVVASRGDEAVVGAAQRQIVRRVRDALLRRHGERVERIGDAIGRRWRRGPGCVRCSTTALASLLTKRPRRGASISTGALRPSCPASSRATSVSVTFAPAHGCEVRSRVVSPLPLRVRSCGSDSGSVGASKSGRAPAARLQSGHRPARSRQSAAITP